MYSQLLPGNALHHDDTQVHRAPLSHDIADNTLAQNRTGHSSWIGTAYSYLTGNNFIRRLLPH